MSISHPTLPPGAPELAIAASRHAVYCRVARWLIHDLRNPAQALTLITELMGEEPVADAPGVADTVREATVHVTHTLELLDRLLRLPPPDAEPRPLSLKENLLLVAALDALDDRKGRIVLRALPDADGVTVTVAWQSSTVKAPAGGTAAETGIAVAKALAERNGGRLTETRPDREAGFRLRLTRWTGHSA